jgi:hypothetical protein
VERLSLAMAVVFVAKAMIWDNGFIRWMRPGLLAPYLWLSLFASKILSYGVFFEKLLPFV